MWRYINESIAKKLSVMISIVIFLLFSAAVIVFYRNTFKRVVEGNTEDLRAQARVVRGMLEQFDENTMDAANQLHGVFVSMFADRIVLDEKSKVTVGKYESPVLRMGRVPLNLRYDEVDRFRNVTNGSVATVFVKLGDDFLRVATSLTKEDGSRAIGTLLGKAHPGYEKLMRGEVYHGRARLFGRDYMTKYTPLKDGSGNVIGVLFIGYHITDGMRNLSDTIKSIRIGPTGYVYVFDAREGPSQGTFVIHPQFEGKKMSDVLAGGGAEAVKEMLGAGSGIITYGLKTAEGKVQEKLAAYEYFRDWQWIVAASWSKEEMMREAAELRNNLLLATIFIAVIISVVIYALLDYMLRPIDRLSADIEAISGGNLSIELGRAGDDEIGRIADNLSGMVISLKSMIGDVSSSMDKSVETVSSLNDSARKADSGAREQAEHASRIATAADEMSATIREIAENTSRASSISESAMSIARAADDSAKGAVRSTQEVSKSTLDLIEMIKRLNKSVLEIGDIVGVINDIADQTNLLALNAAIESARAGEHGRGFSVVADEVRKLSERTIKATSEISNRIVSVQRESESTTQAVGAASREIDKLTVSITGMGGNLDEIVSVVQSVRDEISKISVAIEQQSSTSHEVADNIEKTAVIAGDIRKMSNDIMNEVEHLSAVTGSLKASVMRFKI